MSHAALRWAWGLGNDQRLNAGDRLVLVCLADHHNRKTGLCNPGIERLREATGYSRPSVYGHLKRLREFGYLVWISGGNRANRYSFPPLEKTGLSSAKIDESGSTDGEVAPFLSSGQRYHRSGDVSSGAPDNSVIEEIGPIVWPERRLSSGAPDANIKEHKGPGFNCRSQIPNVEETVEFGAVAEKESVVQTESPRTRDAGTYGGDAAWTDGEAVRCPQQSLDMFSRRELACDRFEPESGPASEPSMDAAPDLESDTNPSAELMRLHDEAIAHH